jgi:hypothetical protein
VSQKSNPLSSKVLVIIIIATFQFEKKSIAVRCAEKIHFDITFEWQTQIPLSTLPSHVVNVRIMQSHGTSIRMLEEEFPSTALFIPPLSPHIAAYNE